MMPIFIVYNKDAGKMYGPVTFVEMLRTEHYNGVVDGTARMMVGKSPYSVDSTKYDHLAFYQYTGWDDADGNMVFEEDHAGDIRIMQHVTGAKNTLHNWSHYFGVE